MASLKNYRFYFAFHVLLLSAGPGFSQTSSTYHFAAGFHYLEVVRGDSTDKHLPVLVAFHFSSSSPEELFTYYGNIQSPLRILIPRGSHPKRNGHSYFPKDHYSTDTATQIKTVSHTLDSVATFLKAVFKRYGVKPVVTGISQGGDLSLLLAIYHPDLVKGSVPIAGFIHRDVYLNLKKSTQPGVPIYLIHGEDDKIVSAAYVKKEAAHLKKNFDVTLAIYPGIGHDVNPAMEKDYSLILRKLLE